MLLFYHPCQLPYTFFGLLYEFKWEKVEELVLSSYNNWSGNFSAVPDGEKHYRIREINSKGQTVHIDTDLDSVQIKTALDKLKDWKKYWEVDWSWDGLSKLLGVDVKRPEPTVVYKVSDANGSHNTKYYVKYDTQGNCTTITNIAVLDISIYKRWLMFGDAKKPKSVYLMLLWRDKDADNGVPYIPVMDVLYGDALTPLDLAGDSVKSLKEALKTVKTLTGYDIESKLSFGAAIGLAATSIDLAAYVYYVVADALSLKEAAQEVGGVALSNGVEVEGCLVERLAHFGLAIVEADYRRLMANIAEQAVYGGAVHILAF